ncbi:unnamed protein product, partial [Closterium sp. NIES-54]
AAAGNSGVSMPGRDTVNGVAPKARLAIYKVFWRMRNYDIRGSETDVFAAVDRAVADGVDVLTLSLDDSYRGHISGNGNSTGAFFEDLPFLGALAAGVSVVLAVGDGGEAKFHYMYGALEAIGNNAPFYISVGASTLPQASLTSTSTSAAAAAAVESPANTTGPAASTLLGARLPATISPADTALPMVPTWSSTGPLTKPGCSLCRPLKLLRRSNAIVKPDIIAPGVSILAAAPGQTVGEKGSFSVYGEETAISAALVAGVAALIIQQHPDWSPAQVMSAMMTTAGRTDSSNKVIRNVNGEPATPWQMGAGHVFPARAFDPGLTYDAGEQDFRNFLAGLNMKLARRVFGQVQLTPVPPRHLNRPSISLVNIITKLTTTRTVTSVSDTTSTYRVRVNAPEAVRVSVVPSQFTIAPGQRVSFKVKVVLRSKFKRFKYGSLTWEDDKGHSVRSVLVLHCKRTCMYYC